MTVAVRQVCIGAFLELTAMPFKPGQSGNPGGVESRRLDNRRRFERAAGFGRGKWFSTSRRARFASKSSRTTKSLTWCRRSKSGARRQRWCFSTVGACQFKDISQQLIVHRLNALGTKSKTLIILNSSFQNTPIPKIVANGPARAAPQRRRKRRGRS